MLQQDLEKRLEEIEMKIEELEDMMLENKLKLMNLCSKLEEKNPPVVELEKRGLPPPPQTKKFEISKPSFFKLREPEMAGELEMRERIKKIKGMLEELK